MRREPKGGSNVHSNQAGSGDTKPSTSQVDGPSGHIWPRPAAGLTLFGAGGRGFESHPDRESNRTGIRCKLTAVLRRSRQRARRPQSALRRSAGVCMARSRRPPDGWDEFIPVPGRRYRESAECCAAPTRVAQRRYRRFPVSCLVAGDEVAARHSHRGATPQVRLRLGASARVSLLLTRAMGPAGRTRRYMRPREMPTTP
jgi:hypothetical protein